MLDDVPNDGIYSFSVGTIFDPDMLGSESYTFGRIWDSQLDEFGGYAIRRK